MKREIAATVDCTHYFLKGEKGKGPFEILGLGENGIPMQGKEEREQLWRRDGIIHG